MLDDRRLLCDNKGCDTIVLEVMVHPGYSGQYWDDFNRSSERETELQVLTVCAANVMSEIAELIGDIDCNVVVATIEDALASKRSNL